MKTIKAIETKYKGYRFRSRLEARWAVFFDALGVRWEYEKEGFEFNGIRYLPDFWLPDLKLWLEIKGELTWEKREYSWGTREESPVVELMQNFRDSLGEWPIALCVGQPGSEEILFFGWNCNDTGGGEFQNDGCEWVWCKERLTIDVKPGRNDTGIYSHYVSGEYLSWFTDPYRIGSSREPLKFAYDAARSARFEHGENPSCK